MQIRPEDVRINVQTSEYVLEMLFLVPYTSYTNPTLWISKCNCHIHVSRHSVVGIATPYWLDGPGIGSR